MGSPINLINEPAYMNNNNIINTKNGLMNDVSSKNIGEFYRDAKIFITGGTGFVGKALLEKLLRSCDLLDTVYLLMRPKRGMVPEQRLRELFKNAVFNRIKEKDPNLFNKVKIIEGDVALPNLGMREVDREKVIENVNIVIHSAATVKFNETLKVAVTLNTLGTHQIMQLCTKIKNLKSCVHVSTAYSNADKTDIDEIVYKPPYDPYTIMTCIENLPDEMLDILEEKLVGKHPNTYTFTKALAESIVCDYSAKIPVCIVRPSIVTGAWQEPFPGWIDNISGVTGIVMEIGRGTIKSILCKKHYKMDVIPVDVVVNTLITAAWHTVANRSNTIRVYNCTSGNVNAISWYDFVALCIKTFKQFPSKYITWYPNCSITASRILHYFNRLFYQTIPAYILDMILVCTNNKPTVQRLNKKFMRACNHGEFFCLNEFDFKVPTFSELKTDVANAEDGEFFYLDIVKEQGFTWEKYNHNYVLGIRKYVLKDDLTSLPSAKSKLVKLYWTNKIVQALALYLAMKMTVL